jgi:thiosulfate/3-mercaptopyruvate sulfurtransferase
MVKSGEGRTPCLLDKGVTMSAPIESRGYVHPDVLVTTEWVARHGNDPDVRLVESDEDILLYEIGHIAGAIKLDWQSDLQDSVRRDFVDRAGFEALLSERGIAPEHTVVFYGDKSNWYATYTLWLFKYFGHESVKIMDGGRMKWEAEGRPYTTSVPSYPPTNYVAKDPDESIRAFREDVLAAVNSGDAQLIDVRSAAEFNGEVIHMAGYPQEGAQRAGHITGARSIPWAMAANPDGTFKSADELAALYESKGIDAETPTIAYCRIGERASHTWFALTYLLGRENVSNYDGSWTEWGSLVNVPIENPSARG